MNVQYSAAGQQIFLPGRRSHHAELPASAAFYHQHSQCAKKISLALTASQVCQLYALVQCCLQRHDPDLVEQRRPYSDVVPLLVENAPADLDHPATEAYRNDPSLLFPPSVSPVSTKQACLACDTSCRNSRALRRHQQEFCERQFEWVCPDCPDQVFGLQDRLNRHHFDAHAATCPRGCNKQKAYPSDQCKMFLSLWSRRMAEKKAWGCPCCTTCFQSVATWNEHGVAHVTQNGKVANWNFSTMVRSLLQQEDLAVICSRYDWSTCDWSRLGKDERWNLRLALERHVLPPGSEEHPTHSCLPILEAVALYAFNLGTVHSVFLDSPETGQFPPMLATTAPSGHGLSAPAMTTGHEPPSAPHPQGMADSDFHFSMDYGMPLSASQATDGTTDSEELMTWDTFLREEVKPSGGCDMYDAPSGRGYGPRVAPQRHTAAASTHRPQDSRGPSEQQRASQSPRARFRRRVHKVIGGAGERPTKCFL